MAKRNVKNPANRKPKGKRGGTGRVKVPRGLGLGSLDSAAAMYAQLLADPCNGPLCTGPFGDGGGGLVSRFETDFIWNNITDTASAIAFTPGVALACTSSVSLVTDTTPFAFSNNVGVSPGYAFLTANAVQFRCLSACVQMYWPGSELNRQGICSVANLPATFVTATGQQVNILRSTSQYVERTPDTMTEIIWRPTSYDLEFTGVAGELAAQTQKRTSLICTAAGIPTTTGIRYRIVAVYEWYPTDANGLVAPVNRGETSVSTFQQVIHALDKAGDWMYHGALETAHAASSLYRGVRAIGQVAYGGVKMAAILSG
jgi:hypothetical protein